jgi:hypothetical protein
MLTLEQCRQNWGDDCPLSNSDLERLRDQLYGLARVVVEACPRWRRGNGPQNAPSAARQANEGAAGHKPAGFPDAVATLPEEDRFEVEERAAIHEFDGGLDRDAAERAALLAFWRSQHQAN